MIGVPLYWGNNQADYEEIFSVLREAGFEFEPVSETESFDENRNQMTTRVYHLSEGVTLKSNQYFAGDRSTSIPPYLYTLEGFGSSEPLRTIEKILRETE